jgi:tubulin polyglutamylase TTLL1/tubulin monoglycylase TTLL3/8
LAGDSVKSTTLKLDSNKREFCFEIYGLDFMIDEEFNTWLIEVNNNPCLALPTALQARIIPTMIENAFRIAVDPFFPPPAECPKSKPIPSELFESNKFTLIYNSSDE